MRSELRTAALGASLAAFAVWLRSLQWALVWTPTGVIPVDGDSFYHFRRIAWSVRNFPAFLSFDPYLNFPRGGEPIWSPTFDFALAATLRAVLGVGEEAALERWLCVVPALLGGLHVALLFFLARRFLSTPAAAAGALLLALLPAHWNYTQLGFVDHHAAVTLVGTLVLFAALQFAARPGRRQAVWLGLAFAGALLVWPGCLIHVAVAEAALLGFCLSRCERAQAVVVARRLAGTHALGALAVAPLCLGQSWIRWGSLSPLVLSDFQPLWLAAGAVSFGALAGIWRRAGFPRSLAVRAAEALAVGAAVAVAAFALVPGFSGAGGADAWAWLARGEEFQASVQESRPLFWRNGELQLRSAVVFLSGGLFLAPLAAGVLLWRARAERRPELAVLVAWSAAFVALAAAQSRFIVDAAPALALLLAAGADAVVASARPSRRRLAAAGALTLGLVACLPLLDWYATRSAAAGTRVRRTALTLDVGRWLRAHSPPTAGWLEPGALPEYGVLGPWGAGHALRYTAQRPVVQDNFGDDVGSEGFAAAEAYFSAESEAAGVAILEALGVRYVLAGPTGSGHGRGYPPESLLARLRSEGSAPARSGAAAPAAAPLVRHNLVYESAPLDPRGGEPHWKLFELVPGPPAPPGPGGAP